MILSPHVERLRTPEQVRTFLDGNEPVDFQPVSRAETYAFVSRMLSRFDYARLGKSDRGLVKGFPGQGDGTVAIVGEASRGAVREDRPRWPWERRYTATDIRLLA